MIARGPTPEVVYPDSDGKPMSDNTLQFQWIQTIEGNLEGLFRDREDVFVAGDNLWYPVEGEPTIRQAPDVYVVFGRPKGHRGSYKQWEENNIPLTVVFETLSPGNTRQEMDEKFMFYDEYGVEEYYIYDPDKEKLTVYLRGRAALRKVPTKKEFVSPRLSIRFDLSEGKLAIFAPDGRPFRTVVEIIAERDEAQQQADQARQQLDESRKEADKMLQQLDETNLRAERLAERLRALGLDPES
jgi:Uma2 family endonuclease